MAVLGWVSLRQWERSSELLFRERAWDMSTMAAEKVDMVPRHTADEFVGRLQTAVAGESLAVRALDDVLAREPLIQRLYVFDRRGERLCPSAWAGE